MSRRLVREIVEIYPDYLEWVSRQDFSPEIIEIAKNAIDGEFPQKN